MLVLLTARPAGAYVRAVTASGKPWHWNHTRLEMNAYLGDPAPGFDCEEMRAAIATAAAPWTEDQLACSVVSVRVVAHPAATAPIVRDGDNRRRARRAR